MHTSKNTSGSVAIAVVMLIIMVGHTRNMALRVPLHAATSVQGSSGGGLMARVGEYYHWYCYYYYVPLLLVEIAIITNCYYCFCDYYCLHWYVLLSLEFLQLLQLLLLLGFNYTILG